MKTTAPGLIDVLKDKTLYVNSLSFLTFQAIVNIIQI